jgi:diaminopimelate decarboxylase
MDHPFAHLLPTSAEIDDSGHLKIGGRDTVELAEEFGTPLQVFCERSFHERAQEFNQAVKGARIYYASKAFLCLAMCRLVEREGLGLDVASAGELHTALSAGFPKERIILHGNNKSDEEIARAVEAGVGLIAIDSLEEVDRLSKAAAAAARVQPVLVRVTPGVEAHTHEYIRTGQEDTKFGVSIQSGAAGETVIRAAETDGLELRGIHSHIGSNILNFDAFSEAVEVLFEFMADIRPQISMEIEEVNLGGGIGIPYTRDDPVPDVRALGSRVLEAASGHTKRLGMASPRISFEPGRFLVGNAMVTLYSVGAIKELPGIRTYLSVDGGMSDNPRPALYGAAYEAMLANRASEDAEAPFTIAGMHCETGDVLIREARLPASTSRGDLLAVPSTGAYAYSMASNYNRKPRPAVVMVREGRSQVIVRRESLDDLIRLDQPLP